MVTVESFYHLMTTYIAKFCARHSIIQIMQHSVFTWKQEGGEVDEDLLKGKIKRESSLHFYKVLAGDQYPVNLDDIEIEVSNMKPFYG